MPAHTAPAQRIRFFAGKGGVGKTTLAAAAAHDLATRGRSVLIVSTDPAHSLGDALGQRLRRTPTRIATAKGSLAAVELDADAGLRRWLRPRRGALGTVLEHGTWLEREDVEKFLELSLPGVDELIGLIELWRLARRVGAPEVVVDTAPTGHTLRLLAMPATLLALASLLEELDAKHRFLTAHLGGGGRPDPTARAIAEIRADAGRIHQQLRDPARCSFVWVTLPERLAVEETLDGVRALHSAGIALELMVINRVSPDPGPGCTFCTPRSEAEQRAIERLARALPAPPRVLIQEAPVEPRGGRALAPIGRTLRAGPDPLPRSPRRGPARHRPTPAVSCWPAGATGRAAEALARLAPDGRRLLCFGGKGGVGKTSVAAAVALALARQQPERRILLLSTDPAHSLGDALAARLGHQPRPVALGSNLLAQELDAGQAFAAEHQRLRETIDSISGTLAGRDGITLAYDPGALEHLLAFTPPGIDELFGMLRMLEALAPADSSAGFDLVVLDTAPTGHALRLLALPSSVQEWLHALLAVLLRYRELTGLGALAKELLASAHRVRELRALLADPERTGFVVVTRMAKLPIRESLRLERALDRLGIPVPAVLVNALTLGDCRRCRARRRREQVELARLSGALAGRRRGQCAMIFAPAVAPPPRGLRALTRWGRSFRLLAPPAPRSRRAR